jgi:hypothetical protein
LAWDVVGATPERETHSFPQNLTFASRPPFNPHTFNKREKAMISGTDHRVDIDATAALNGILALLATAGLSDDQTAAVTGRDPRHVRTLLGSAAEPPARELSVIDRARLTLLARSQG